MSAHERGMHRVSRAFAHLAARSFPNLPEAHKMLAIAQSRLGRHDDAIALLEAVYDDLPAGRERAEATLCAAATSLRLPSAERAALWMQRAHQEDAAFVLQRLDDPMYAPLRNQPGFEGLMNGSAGVLGHMAMDVAFA